MDQVNRPQETDWTVSRNGISLQQEIFSGLLSESNNLFE